MNRLSRLLPAYRLCSNNIKLLQPQNLGLVRFQPRLNYAELPRIKKPGEGKGPITWKSVKIIAVGGAIMLGVLKYMEAQKDAGKTQKDTTFENCLWLLNFVIVLFICSKRKRATKDHWESSHRWPMGTDDDNRRKEKIIRFPWQMVFNLFRIHTLSRRLSR